MIFGIIGDVVKTVAGGFVAKSKAKTEADIKIIQADIGVQKARVKEAETSWKDEYWTILLSIPMIGAFIPFFSPFIERGFEVISQMPEWYRYYVGAAISVAFGLRQVKSITRGKRIQSIEKQGEKA